MDDGVGSNRCCVAEREVEEHLEDLSWIEIVEQGVELVRLRTARTGSKW
jgi:hypothetical protein